MPTPADNFCATWVVRALGSKADLWESGDCDDLTLILISRLLGLRVLSPPGDESWLCMNVEMGETVNDSSSSCFDSSPEVRCKSTNI